MRLTYCVVVALKLILELR